MVEETTSAPRIPRAWALVGHYFRILAFVSLLKMAATILRGKGLTIDLSFILLFWVGRGLLEGRKRPRIVAIVICSLFLVSAVVTLVQSVIENELWKPSWGSPAALQFAIVTCGLFLAILLPPHPGSSESPTAPASGTVPPGPSRSDLMTCIPPTCRSSSTCDSRNCLANLSTNPTSSSCGQTAGSFPSPAG
jgi:hypothetical protein